ncbi:hypothetical protein ACWIUD_10405 [Helicobacter sp. 23-1044]
MRSNRRNSIFEIFRYAQSVGLDKETSALPCFASVAKQPNDKNLDCFALLSQGLAMTNKAWIASLRSLSLTRLAMTKLGQILRFDKIFVRDSAKIIANRRIYIAI